MTERRAGVERWRGRLRLWSGCVLFTYVTLHLMNHALGLVSLDAMEAGRWWFVALWRNPIGAVALYSAFIVHISMALWSIYRRRTWRMPAWEATQLALGLSIPVLLAGHVVGTKMANLLYGQVDPYSRVALSLWHFRPELGLAPDHRAGHRVGPRVHRHPLLAPPAAMVSAGTAVALRRRAPAAGAGIARLRQCRAQRRNAGARAGRRGAIAQADPHAPAIRRPQADRVDDLLHVRRRPRRRPARAGRASCARASARDDPDQLSGRAAGHRADRIHHSRGESARADPPRVGVWRARALLHVPRPRRRGPQSHPRRERRRASACSSASERHPACAWPASRDRGGTCPCGRSSHPTPRPRRASSRPARWWATSRR